MVLTWIELSPVEQRLVEYVAKLRRANCAAAGVRNAKFGSQSDEETDRLGVAGEIAFAKLFNVFPDLTTEPRHGGADSDVGPYRIDVKTTKYPTGRLLAATWKTILDVDVYALILAEPPRYGFCGFARAGDLLHPSRLADVAGRSGYSLDQTALRPDLPITAADIHWSGR